MIAIFELLELVLIGTLILGAVTQVIVPVLVGKPLFWSFRPKSPESRRERSLQRLKAAQQRLEEAQFRKETAEKEAEAARLEAEEVRLRSEAMNIRIKSASTLYDAVDAPASEETGEPQTKTEVPIKNKS